MLPSSKVKRPFSCNLKEQMIEASGTRCTDCQVPKCVALLARAKVRYTHLLPGKGRIIALRNIWSWTETRETTPKAEPSAHIIWDFIIGNNKVYRYALFLSLQKKLIGLVCQVGSGEALLSNIILSMHWDEAGITAAILFIVTAITYYIVNNYLLSQANDHYTNPSKFWLMVCVLNFMFSLSIKHSIF